MPFVYTYAPTVPVGSADAGTLNVVLTNFKNALNERLALEHQDLVSGSSDNNADAAQGRHIPGKVSLVYCDNEATILALTSGIPKYAMAYSIDTNNIFIFNGTDWDTYQINLQNPSFTGVVLMWPSDTAPDGWLLCDGSTFDAGEYPALNTLLGGNTLPDFRYSIPYGVTSEPLGTLTTNGEASPQNLTHAHAFTAGPTIKITGGTVATFRDYVGYRTDYFAPLMPVYAINFIIKT